MSTKREREPEPEDDVRTSKQGGKKQDGATELGGATTLGVSMETKRVIMERLFENVRSSIAGNKMFTRVGTHDDYFDITVGDINVQIRWKVRMDNKKKFAFYVTTVYVVTLAEIAIAQTDCDYEFTPKGVLTDVCCMLLCKMRAELEYVAASEDVIIIIESILNEPWYAALLAKGVWVHRDVSNEDHCVKLTLGKAMAHLASKADVTDA
jgi:hypothetical protein